jgi:hypothetical protein
MSKKTKPSTSQPSVLPTPKTRGKAKGARKGATKAGLDVPTIPLETPTPDAVETPTPPTAPETASAPLGTTEDAGKAEGGTEQKNSASFEQ